MAGYVAVYNDGRRVVHEPIRTEKSNTRSFADIYVERQRELAKEYREREAKVHAERNKMQWLYYMDREIV